MRLETLELLVSGKTRSVEMNANAYEYISSVKIFMSREDNFGYEENFLMEVTFLDGSKTHNILRVMADTDRNTNVIIKIKFLMYEITATLDLLHERFRDKLALPGANSSSSQQRQPELASGRMLITEDFDVTEPYQQHWHINPAVQAEGNATGLGAISNYSVFDDMQSVRGTEPIAFGPRSSDEDNNSRPLQDFNHAFSQRLEVTDRILAGIQQEAQFESARSVGVDLSAEGRSYTAITRVEIINRETPQELEPELKVGKRRVKFF